MKIWSQKLIKNSNSQSNSHRYSNYYFHELIENFSWLRPIIWSVFKFSPTSSIEDTFFGISFLTPRVRRHTSFQEFAFRLLLSHFRTSWCDRRVIGECILVSIAQIKRIVLVVGGNLITLLSNNLTTGSQPVHLRARFGFGLSRF